MAYINIQQLNELDAEFAQSPSPSISWQSAARSHVGCVRNLNEDAFLNSVEQNLWVVADGMGGHSRGDYASKVVVEALVHFARSQTLPASIVDLEVRLRRAHESCRASFDDKRVGSTVTAMLAFGPCVFLLWAGDSRVYRWRNGEMQQLTTDHTLAQRKVASGELTPARAALHPSAHVLTRAVGVHQTLHLDLDYTPVENGDRFLLCSDGVYNELSNADLQLNLARNTQQEVLDGVFDRALERGGRDNLTAIVCDAQVDKS